MTMIWLPKCREIELPSQRVGLSGQYRLVVKEADGTVAKDTGWFDNIITDLGLNRFATALNMNVISIGTGTATPTAADTTLQTFVQFSDTGAPGAAYSPAYPPQNTTSPYATGYTFGYRFSIGRLNGTFSEVGISSTNDGTSLTSRALIVGGGGTPTTITVNSSQQLDAFYTFRRYPPLVDVTNTVVINGTTHVATGRASGAGEIFGWHPLRAFNGLGGNGFYVLNAGAALGPITGQLTGGTQGNQTVNTITNSTYVSGSFTRESSQYFGTDNGNVSGGIRGMAWNIDVYGCTFQYVLDVAIPKDVTKTMNLNVRVAWARV